MPQHYSIRIQNQIPQIAKVCEGIDDFSKQHLIPDKVVFALHLSLDEILTNIISYGYADGGEHEINVCLETDGENLTLIIQDDSRPFDPTQAPEPDLDKPLENRRIGGLGLYLVKNLMDSIEYASNGAINTLTLKKKL